MYQAAPFGWPQGIIEIDQLGNLTGIKSSFCFFTGIWIFADFYFTNPHFYFFKIEANS